MITIVNYGMGNMGSVYNMFKYLGYKSVITSDPETISKAEKILLPGIGAFDAAMSQIRQRGLKDILDHKAQIEQVPILGICLGMQLLTNGSEEGKLPGFGWIDGYTYHFKGKIDTQYKIPHMGWNIAEIANDTLLTRGYEGEVRYYFVHSYYVTVDDNACSMMKTTYGVKFDSAICRNNIFGTQFHPEKSHKFGMKLFENFAKI